MAESKGVPEIKPVAMHGLATLLKIAIFYLNQPTLTLTAILKLNPKFLLFNGIKCHILSNEADFTPDAQIPNFESNYIKF